MSNENQAIIDKLNELYKDDSKTIKKLPLKNGVKYVLFSDLHFGDGKKADNFVHNEKIMENALTYYFKNGFSIILLGDIDEFWQFDLIDIEKRYGKSVYKLLNDFSPDRIHRVFGNHDKEWAGLPDPIFGNKIMHHGAPEAVMLENDIIMVHGHQGDVMSDKNAWSSRFWVRMFKKIEPIARLFGYENYEATKSQIPQNRECVYYKWAKKKKMILICGHTHRAIFASRIYYQWLKEQIEKKKKQKNDETVDKKKRKKMAKEINKLKKSQRYEKKNGRDMNPLEESGFPVPCYFNTGSGLYKGGITCIEVEKDKIRLIKWQNDPKLIPEKRRILLWKEEDLQKLLKEVKKDS